MGRRKVISALYRLKSDGASRRPFCFRLSDRTCIECSKKYIARSPSDSPIRLLDSTILWKKSDVYSQHCNGTADNHKPSSDSIFASYHIDSLHYIFAVQVIVKLTASLVTAIKIFKHANVRALTSAELWNMYFTTIVIGFTKDLSLADCCAWCSRRYRSANSTSLQGDSIRAS